MWPDEGSTRTRLCHARYKELWPLAKPVLEVSMLARDIPRGR